MDRIALTFVVALLAAGCTSPESTRTRGGGSGADLGNRAAHVLMHEGSKPYDRTPKLQPAQAPALDPASQAHSLSIER